MLLYGGAVVKNAVSGGAVFVDGVLLGSGCCCAYTGSYMVMFSCTWCQSFGYYGWNTQRLLHALDAGPRCCVPSLGAATKRLLIVEAKFH